MDWDGIIALGEGRWNELEWGGWVRVEKLGEFQWVEFKAWIAVGGLQ